MTTSSSDSTGNGATDQDRSMSTIDDPFVSPSEGQAVPRESHRYSSFDTQLFSLDASSPAQAKRALEAHLAETERRLEEASKLGTALIEQQRELEEKLKEVEQQQEEGQIGPDLRRKLADLEREYNEIGRETARAFLAPKRLAGGDEAHLSTPSIDQKSPLSPALFASQATNSPSKVSVPSRKQRNQPSSRVHDIEFATEISTSLLAQVRQLQALLAEREESLKVVNLEKSRLELEAEGYAQRIRALDESEERYKDENWALETRTHELMATIKEATDRETRLNSSLGAATTEKNALERELEDLKQTNSKLLEDQTVAQKANDAELHLLRRNLNAGDLERQSLQQKLEELNSQNQELAKAVAMRLRQHEAESTRDAPRDDDSDDQGRATPDNSPPPSPNKFTPRHNHLETETLRSSLGHAHRMIQNLKSTIHREKTEKIELKRMLQEARDEVEQRRREGAGPAGPSNKRQKTKADAQRKPRPDLLGAGRRGTTEIEVHESDWEDNGADSSPSHKASLKSSRGPPGGQSSDEPSDVYHTATEADDAFETANERETATESDAFQTGIESMADSSSDSGDATETEDRLQRTPRGRVSSLTLTKTRERTSYQSTASTSGDEDDTEPEEFPSPSQVSTPRYRLRKKRSVQRRIRPSGEAPMASTSRPSSARESPAASFNDESESPEGQSLFAELAELDGEDEGEFGPAMPSSTSTPRMMPMSDSRRPSEAPLEAPPRPTMVDSGVMTDPWEPATSIGQELAGEEAVSSVPATPKKTSDAGTATGAPESPQMAHSATQWTPLKAPLDRNGDAVSNVPTPPKRAWDDHAPDAQRDADGEPVLPQLDISSISTQETAPVAPTRPDLSTAYLVGGLTEPIALPTAEPAEMRYSTISSQSTDPVVARLPTPEPVYEPNMNVSSILAEHTLPIVATPVEPVVVPPVSVSERATSTDFQPLEVSTIFSEHTEPVVATLPEPIPVPIPEPTPEVTVAERAAQCDLPDLAVSILTPESTEPVAPRVPEATPVPGLVVSLLTPESTEPVVPQTPEPAPVPELALSLITPESIEPVTPQVTKVAQAPELAISILTPESTEPAAPQLPEVVPAPEISAPMPELSLSTVHALETLPVQCTPAAVTLPAALPDHVAYTTQDRGAGPDMPIPQTPTVVVAEDDATEDSVNGTKDQETESVLPLGSISGNAGPRHARRLSSSQLADQGAQTILSSKQIDQLLLDRVTSRPLSPPDSDKAKELSNSPFATPKARPRPAHQASTTSLQRRPGSANSLSSSVHSHPPLPSDHKEAIMAAEKKSIEQRPGSPALMGPPLAPASAYKTNAPQRPRTPNEGHAYVGSTKTASSRVKGRRESQVSRRSSVSSFASEVEERFNGHPNAAGFPYGYPAGTDARMIQAITQTMIGEFLWKYTRKAVSGEISNTRHRRYFWVHPYTRTLYWSEHDPQSAGKTEGRTKSVPIEAVRVVADDNPYPPGLHCRSLEVVSPGRRIRFTATTSQRHETWFNALSYLLLRNPSEEGEEENNVTLEDIDEFNPGFRSRSQQTARMSISSSQSRPLRNPPKQRAASAMSVRNNNNNNNTLTPGRVSPALSTPSQYSDQVRHSSTSRLSTILNSTIKGSIGRRGPGYASSSLHDGSVHDHDSEEDLRHMMEQQEQNDRLENVRACCDGKHDVGSLSRMSRYSPRVNRIHSHH
ncbi:putative nuclear migration protein (ApsA) [Aspergillus affinis]|uniref:putative nuclear migration protein (ApsA) n=1 Tax=Aspergillus affinis TaxID=1070780 RepID=UPI0022FDD6BC|nr:uncharacterized protein KD926_001712 [Aspergillus affinis]KAI9036501.1 hypothetical protein KD926_001712 [Aspergillus affinis]